MGVYSRHAGRRTEVKMTRWMITASPFLNVSLFAIILANNFGIATASSITTIDYLDGTSRHLSAGTSAFGINDDGQTVGQYYDATGTVHGFLDAPTVVLFRPTGEAELTLIRQADWRAFPPRLPGQPFFYLVLNGAYATQIARDWNTKDGGTATWFGFRLNNRFRTATQFKSQGRESIKNTGFRLMH